MLEMLRDLVAHKGHANAAMLTAISANDAAAADGELSELLHHILLANRFWYSMLAGLPFVLDHERRTSASFGELAARYADLQQAEESWLAGATEADLARILRHEWMPGGECSAVNGLLQVCLHTQGHRAQAAKLLRRHGGVPPMTDFIVWQAHRSPAAWPTSAA